MLLVISIVALVGGIVWNAYCECYEWEGAVSFAMAFVGGLCTVVAVVIWICCHIGVDGQVMSWEQQYDMLTYQLENNLYDNDNDIGKKELMNQIQDWNTDLAWYKANQNDLWIGVFIPNVFDQFEYITVRK